MTDEITVNGMGVSDCVYYTSEGACDNNGCYSYWCIDNPACYYKQLQKEKQENKKVKKTLKEIAEIATVWLKNDWSCYYCRKNMDEQLRNCVVPEIGKYIFEKITGGRK